MIDIINTEWIGNMVFESDISGHKVRMDSEEQFGGINAGPRPKPLLLSALSGCTAMDVVSILRKKKVSFDTFHISVSGDVTEEHPKSYKKIDIVYEFSGKGFVDNINVLTKIQRAIQLSMDKYCAIAAMLKDVCELTTEVRLANS